VVTGVQTIPLSSNLAVESLSEDECLPQFGLRQFIAGPENSLVAVTVDELLAPETTFNPLVIYGPTGTGKSFLAEGLARRWQAQQDGVQSKTVVTTATDFARAYAGALETRSLDEFRQTYRDAGFLVIEDLPQIARKRAAQQELARTIDECLLHGGRIVVTSQRPLHDMALVRELKSRLSAGLAVPLSTPGKDARRVILNELALQQNIRLTTASAKLLADELAFTVPFLNRTLIELKQSLADATHDIATKDITIAQVRSFIKARFSRYHPALRDITNTTARQFGLRVSELKGPARQQPLVRARGVAMFVARTLTEKSLQQIGRHFGGRDHTTVLHACRKTEQLVKTDPAIRLAVDEVKAKLTKNLTGGFVLDR